MIKVTICTLCCENEDLGRKIGLYAKKNKTTLYEARKQFKEKCVSFFTGIEEVNLCKDCVEKMYYEFINKEL